MSYSARISFKKVEKEGDVFAFLRSFREAINENAASIIVKEGLTWSPLWSKAYAHAQRDDELIGLMRKRPSEMTREETERDIQWENTMCEWVKKFFTFRFGYLQEEKTLYVYGVPVALQSLFDKTVFFQDGTDQDYSFGTWKGIDWMEAIVEKAKKSHGAWYYKRWNAYVRVWEKIEPEFDADESSLHFIALDTITGYHRIKQCWVRLRNAVAHYNELLDEAEENISKKEK